MRAERQLAARASSAGLPLREQPALLRPPRAQESHGIGGDWPGHWAVHPDATGICAGGDHWTGATSTEIAARPKHGNLSDVRTSTGRLRRRAAHSMLLAERVRWPGDRIK